tara:strand:+ start:92 stop:220 length:129 start_codon:yes stop_codon:yes gene_type:complete
LGFFYGKYFYLKEGKSFLRPIEILALKAHQKTCQLTKELLSA